MGKPDESYKVIECPECGAPLGDAKPGEDARCQYCGAVLHPRHHKHKKKHEQHPQPAASKPPDPAPARPKRKRKISWLLVLQLSACAVIVLFGGYRILMISLSRARLGALRRFRPVIVDVNGDGVKDVVLAFERRPSDGNLHAKVYVGALDGRRLHHMLWSVGPLGGRDVVNGKEPIAAFGVAGHKLVVAENLGRIVVFDFKGHKLHTTLLDEVPSKLCITPAGGAWAAKQLVDTSTGTSQPAPRPPDGCSTRFTSRHTSHQPTFAMKVDRGDETDDYRRVPLPPLRHYKFDTWAIRESSDAGVGLAQPKVRARQPTLVGFDPSTGKERWRALTCDSEKLLDIVDGVFIHACPGRHGSELELFDARSGRRLHDVPLRVPADKYAYGAANGVLYVIVIGKSWLSGHLSPHADPPVVAINLHTGRVLGWWGSEQPAAGQCRWRLGCLLWRRSLARVAR